MELQPKDVEATRLSDTQYMDPTAPPVNPPSYEQSVGKDKEDHYQVPKPTPRPVGTKEPEDGKESDSRVAVAEPRTANKSTDYTSEVDKIFEHGLLGFRTKNHFAVEVFKLKGWFGFCCMSKRFIMRTNDIEMAHIKIALIRTSPTSCDFLSKLMFCGCLKKPVRIGIADMQKNELFYMNIPLGCFCRSHARIYSARDNSLIAKIVKRGIIPPLFVIFDRDNVERMRVLGSYWAGFVGTGEMIFYASVENDFGDRDTIALIKKRKLCYYVDFNNNGLKNVQEDGFARLLVVSTAFLIELVYYGHNTIITQHALSGIARSRAPPTFSGQVI